MESIRNLFVGEGGMSFNSFFSVCFFVYWIVWTLNIANIQRSVNEIPMTKSDDKPVVFAIHRWISLVLFLQFLSTFAESAEHGDAVVWSIFCFFINFVNRAVFYSVIILIGSGWSFVKPFLGFKEKAVLVAVVFLQAFYSVAQAVVYPKQRSKEGYSMYDRDKWDTWAAVISSFDVLCSFLVCFPVYWHVRPLWNSFKRAKEARNAELGSDMESVTKIPIPPALKLFMRLYLALFIHVYARLILYLNGLPGSADENFSDVKYAEELLALGILVLVGIMFRPMPPNTYLSLVGATPDADEEHPKRTLEHSAWMEALSENKIEVEALAQKTKEPTEENKRCMEEISNLSRPFNEFAEQYRLDKELEETSSTVSEEMGMP